MKIIAFTEDDYIFFEKIRRKAKSKKESEGKYFDFEEEILLHSQVFGSIHTIEDSKIPNFHQDKGYRKDYYQKVKIRPGVVTFPPSEETYFETEWAPMSTKIHNRDPQRTVLLLKGLEKVVEDSVILLDYRWWYKFTTLSSRKGKLSAEKREELEKKLNALRIKEINQNE